jgi:hypothetical protein
LHHSKALFHKRELSFLSKSIIFSKVQVVGEGTEASFSTVLAFGVLEILAPLLALSRNCLLFFVGLRALA